MLRLLKAIRPSAAPRTTARVGWWHGVLGAVLVATFVTGSLVSAAAQGSPPSPTATLEPSLMGARSLGDRFYPTLGNGATTSSTTTSS